MNRSKMPIPDPPEAPLLLPFEPGPYRLATGLHACPEADWIQIDARYRAELGLRRALLDLRRDEVLGVDPATAPARREVLELLAAHLPARFPAWFGCEPGRRLRNRLTGEVWTLADPGSDPLEVAARLVQEDMCLLRLDGTTPILTDAALCFPSRWRLTEKPGRPLTAVHHPVPGYADRLAGPVDRFLSALRPGRIVQRANWGVVDDPALFQPAAPAAGTVITKADAGDRLWLRVERQTLRRLAISGAILFTIRVQVAAFSRLAAAPERARLAAALRALPDATARYKSLTAFRDTALAFLDAHA